MTSYLQNNACASQYPVMKIPRIAVVTPVRKAASYEQRKTIIEFGSLAVSKELWDISEVIRDNCNLLSRSATYYAALTRVSSLPHGSR